MTAPTRGSDTGYPNTMSLLQSLWQNDPSPEYAEAAARGHRTSKPKHAVIVAIAVVLGILLAAATVQLRTPKPAAQKTRDYLIDRIHAKTKSADELAEKNAKTSAAIEAAQTKALHGDNKALLTRYKNLKVAAGATAMSGAGIRLALSDGDSDQKSDTDPRAGDGSDSRVQDRDIQTIVNALWAAGAKAVTVNGARLTSLSSIRSAGGAILVDYKPLSQPYTIDALGDSDTLQARLAASSGGSYLQSLKSNYGIDVSIQAESDLTMPASDSLRLHVAHTPKSGKSAPTGGS
ncbi:DUF881 domain-containing protein [Spelaeicoccus albus]|uniref:Uncharacterized protein YlxW (UPF0749 family) n=1 Tax=Spelaeicoccus albus TaxID=1280376 RepID=A0A7Z0IJ10_9MICO|nr:DUF881 domain-containing protein [Spelaeicoccus albus]NYI69019.1 uncharacterized protein YlxW (UPF0749 family) [Spelaeicoccus albus]